MDLYVGLCYQKEVSSSAIFNQKEDVQNQGDIMESKKKIQKKRIDWFIC